MTSTLSIINWAPTKITATLNQIQLSALSTSTPSDNYYPYNLDVPRVPGAPPPGSWGSVNSLTLKSTDVSWTRIYNYLTEPRGAKPNIALMLWVFQDYLVFSQIGEQLGPTISPN
jgi:hypothetical protein